MASLILISCEKGHGFDCFKGTGKIIQESRNVGEINNIILYDNVNLILQQDSAESIVVEAGEKIIGSIKTELYGGQLIIKNENRCNWIRSYKKEINVYLSVRDLHKIIYYGSGDITSLNSIVSDLLEIEIHDGAGSINLIIDTEASWFTLHLGVADIKVIGQSDINYVYTAGYGPIDCTSLLTDITYITNNGSNNCFVNVKDVLEAKIGSVGNIYYKGDPSSVKSEITGSGKLIKTD